MLTPSAGLLEEHLLTGGLSLERSGEGDLEHRLVSQRQNLHLGSQKLSLRSGLQWQAYVGGDPGKRLSLRLCALVP